MPSGTSAAGPSGRPSVTSAPPSPPGAYDRAPAPVAQRRRRNLKQSLDGLPRGLDLSKEERSRVRAAARAWSQARELELREIINPWSALIPAVISFAPVFVAILYARSYLLPIVAVALAMQLPLTLWIMKRIQWPAICRALAATGYECCPSCGYDVRSLSVTVRECPECGGERVPAAWLAGNPPAAAASNPHAQAGDPA